MAYSPNPYATAQRTVSSAEIDVGLRQYMLRVYNYMDGGLLYGYTTKRNLSGFGSFLIMGVWGLFLAVIVSWIWPSEQLQFVISAAGVLIFAGLVAYDTQAIKESYVEGMERDAETKQAVFGAWMLYISFVNLFQFLLYFLGQRD
jgi:uncharacterized protein